MILPDFLREQRETLGFSVKAVSEDLQLPLKYIHALEAGDWGSMPPRIYTRGFLKKYAAYLNLDIEAVLAAFDSAVPQQKETASVDFFPLRSFRRVRFSFFRLKRISVLIFCGVVFVLFYFGYEFRHVLLPPQIRVESPAHNMVVESDSVAIRGRIEKDADLWVNGRQLFADETGVFNDRAFLRKGLNILVFEAKNRFGKMYTATRYIIVQ